MKGKKNIAVFASGSGSNAQILIEHFKESLVARVSLVVCNRKGAGVIERAAKLGVPVMMTNRNLITSGETLSKLRSAGVDILVLAGFLMMIPSGIITAYSDSIINVHPSLLPKYGGKGMYGHHVHEAVLLNKEAETGITIHLVNEHYDEGRILQQFRCPVHEDDSIETLQKRVQALEHHHFPLVVEKHIRE